MEAIIWTNGRFICYNKTNEFGELNMNFTDIFKSMPPEEICTKFDIFELVGKDFYAVTAGKDKQYNSMIGSGGGVGLLFKKPATWCLFRSDRYTLELIQKERTYTLSFFPAEYKEAMMFLGKSSGRDSDKMEKVSLTVIQTPSGDTAFLEAGLILECKLVIQTVVKPEDFFSQEATDYVSGEYKTESGYRKIVFGEITHAWIKNSFTKNIG